MKDINRYLRGGCVSLPCLLFLVLAGCSGGTARNLNGEQALPIAPEDKGITDMTDKVVKSNEEWRDLLTPEQFHVLREKGTERAFTGEYWNTKTPGLYRCAACGAELFTSDHKFDSGCGWPSFYQPLENTRIAEARDLS
jgi:hypothetical protein